MHIELKTLRSGFDYQTCWVGPCVAVADDHRRAVMGIAELTLTGSDVFAGTHMMYSDNGDESWSDPVLPPVFARRPHLNQPDYTTCFGVRLHYHRHSDRFIGLTQQVNYTPANKVCHELPRALGMSVLDFSTRTWSTPVPIEVPELFNQPGQQFGVQHVELPDGDLLMPISVRPQNADGMGVFSTYIVRLRINHTAAQIIEYGAPLSVNVPRGLYEPSLTCYQGRYYLSLRNDITGYVAVSDDGLNFSQLQPWCFDDGELLGNYNTQQRWIRHGDKALYLVYNRRCEDNQHVFRHRAPLFIAQVDCDSLRIMRETERVLVPNRGARLGNFGAEELSPDKTWLTVAEWMQNDDKGFGETGARHCASFGSDNAVFLAEITF